MTRFLVPLFLVIAQAVTAADLSGINNNYWQCYTQDVDNLQWTVSNSYKLLAINQSYAQCKKASRYPKTCKSAKSACELFINGMTTRPMWRCPAFDQTARVWLSNIYANQDNAALAARAYCQQASSVPDTCFTNVIACKNFNANTRE
jgi:hypothetical protein